MLMCLRDDEGLFFTLPLAERTIYSHLDVGVGENGRILVITKIEIEQKYGKMKLHNLH